MPISDASFMLRSTGTLNASETSATGVHTGKGPIQGMKLRIYVPSVTGTSPTCDIKLQECATLGGSYTDVAGGAVPQITAAGTYELHVHWLQSYIRHHTTLGGTTPVFGVTTIGLTAGEITTT